MNAGGESRNNPSSDPMAEAVKSFIGWCVVCRKCESLTSGFSALPGGVPTIAVGIARRRLEASGKDSATRGECPIFPPRGESANHSRSAASKVIGVVEDCSFLFDKCGKKQESSSSDPLSTNDPKCRSRGAASCRAPLNDRILLISCPACSSGVATPLVTETRSVEQDEKEDSFIRDS